MVNERQFFGTITVNLASSVLVTFNTASIPLGYSYIRPKELDFTCYFQDITNGRNYPGQAFGVMYFRDIGTNRAIIRLDSGSASNATMNRTELPVTSLYENKYIGCEKIELGRFSVMEMQLGFVTEAALPLNYNFISTFLFTFEFE